MKRKLLVAMAVVSLLTFAVASSAATKPIRDPFAWVDFGVDSQNDADILSFTDEVAGCFSGYGDYNGASAVLHPFHPDGGDSEPWGWVTFQWETRNNARYLELRALDSTLDDDFDVYVLNKKSVWAKVYSHEADGLGNWKTHTIRRLTTARDGYKSLNVRIVIPDTSVNYDFTCGQLAVDYIKVY